MTMAIAFQMASLGAETLSIDLGREGAAQEWLFAGDEGGITDGELVLNGRGQEQAKAFYLPQEWDDVSLEASFLVEPADVGVLACGFVVRAQDAETYYYVHYDRTQAILVRSSRDRGWNEIQRLGGLEKPAGQWHHAKLEATGHTLRVYLNGKLLFESEDQVLAGGRIGFYAGQGLVRIKDIKVSGESRPAETPFAVPSPRYVYVCTDAGAGGYEAFPDVCRLADGRLMAVFYAGYGHVALPNEQLPMGGRICSCTSEDEGRTWSDATIVYDGPDDDRDPSIAQLKNGRLVCNFFSLRKKADASPPWQGMGSWTVVSDDGGQTWSQPRPIAGDKYYASAPVRELSDGRLMLGLYYANGDASGAVVTSKDGGDTWQDVVEIDNGPYRLDAETDVIELADGSLFAALRGDGETLMCWSKSTDGGRTWSAAQSIGFLGHCPYLHRTVDGILIVGHRQPSTSLHYSLDEARTWSENVLVDEMGGAYPSMVNLRDGSVLIVYYEEGEGSSIRAKRFRATHHGIEWLDFEG